MAFIKVGRGCFNTSTIAHAIALPSESDIEEVNVINTRGERFRFVGDDARAAWKALSALAVDVGNDASNALERHIQEATG